MSQLYDLMIWILKKPELTITVAGWLVTYWLVIRAQKKQHRNEINHQVYKDLVHELDDYANQLSEFSSKVQAYKFTKTYKHLGTQNQAIKRWLKEVIQVGTDLWFYKFLQKWESYEIFLQDLQNIMLIFKRENNKITKEFQEIFLLSDPEQNITKDEKGFEQKLDNLWGLLVNVSCYLIDLKKVLQNFFYKHYGLKALSSRQPEDKKYFVLTESGLININKRKNWLSRLFFWR